MQRRQKKKFFTFSMKMLFQYTDKPEREAQSPKCTAAETVNATVFPRTAWWISRSTASNDKQKSTAAELVL